MVEAQPRRAHPPVIHLHPHVGAGEERGRETDERGQRDEKDVEGIDEELLVRDDEIAFAHDARGERAGGEERHEADRDIQLGRPAPRAEDAEHQRAGERASEQEEEFHLSRPPSGELRCVS